VNTSFDVPPGGTLTIEPGVRVLFGSGASLTVNGQLFAMGERTIASPLHATPA